MAQYENYAGIVEHPKFKELITELGFKSAKDVGLLDQEAILFCFRYRLDDLNDTEKSDADKYMGKPDEKNEVLEPSDEMKNFATEKFGKPYDELTDTQKLFGTVSFFVHKQAEAEKAKQEQEKQQQEQPVAGGNGADVKQNENVEQILDDMKRIRSAYSDSNEQWLRWGSDVNEQWLRWEKLNTLKEMGVVKEDMPQMLDVVATVDLMQKYEPNLSEKQIKEMMEKVTDKVLDDEEYFEMLPPKVLAAMYDDFKEQVKKEKDEPKKQQMLARINKIAGRMDDLAEMVAKDKELYFADVTNIADAYNGYNAMFVARYNDLMAEAKDGETDEAKSLASEKLQNYHDCMEVAKGKVEEYDSVYNLENVSAENADSLDKRFEEMRKAIQGVEIDAETAKLVSNFKFIDREYFTLDAEQLQALQEKFPGKDFSAVKTYSMLNDAEIGYLDAQGMLPKAEPQFIDADGNVSDKWSEGAKVIPGSKLDKAILAAKQSVMLENLGTDTEITPEFLTQAVSSQLPKTLYSLHVVDQVMQGTMENPDQYTNPKYLEEFMAKLGNVEEPMAIGPRSFDAGLDNIVNQTGGYAERLAQRLSVDKDGKEVKNPNINVATKLFEPIESIDKNAKDRIAMKAEGKQNYWLTVAKTSASAFTMSAAMRLIGTAAQSATGVAWAGAGIGSLIGVGLTAYQIRKWNKERKAAGLGTGWADFKKDRRMLMTLGTTILGVAATVSMAIPGGQVAGMFLGGAAMAVGSYNGARTAYKAAIASGDGKWKSFLKAAGVVVAAGASAWLGKTAADFAIDQYNQYDPKNEVFKHKDVTPGTKPTTRIEIDRGELEADANRYNEQYNISDRVHHGMNHNDYMDAVKDYNAAHPENPITNPDELLKGAYNSQHGRVYGPGYVAEHGLDPNVVKSVGNLINPDGTINPTAVEAWNGSELWKESGLQNFVQRVGEPVELRPDLYPNRTPESTYSGVDMPTKEVVVPGKDPVIDYIDNDRHLGFAMAGVMGAAVTQKKTLKERVGSLMDRIIGRKKPEEQKQDVIPPKKQEEQKQDVIPSKKQKEELHPIKVDGDDKKKYKKQTIQIMAPDEDLLKKEYQLVHGTDDCKKSSLIEYKKIVYNEYEEAIQNKKTNADFNGYLKERMSSFDKQVAENLGVKNIKDAKQSEVEEIIQDARNVAFGTHKGNRNDVTILSVGKMLMPSVKENSNTVSMRKVSSKEK